MNYYYYIVTFTDGRRIANTRISKKLAEAAHLAFTEEMIRLNVQSVEWGIMP